MVGLIFKNSSKNPRPRQSSPKRTGPAPVINRPKEIWDRSPVEKRGDLDVVELTDPQTGFKTVHVKDNNPKCNEKEKAQYIKNLVGNNPGKTHEKGFVVGISKREE